jgi:hypothetical protein
MTRPPPWIPSVDRPLAAAARAVRLLGVVTPGNADRERERIAAEFSAGREATPRWEYARAPEAPGAAELAEASRVLARAERSDIAELYAARVEEVALEARIAAGVGTPAFSELAAARFAPRGDGASQAALAQARDWLAAPPPSASPTSIRSDAPSPDSLLSRMRAEVGRLKLPFAVVVHPGLAPLAATGERAILVAPGRDVSDEDIARTVLHEVLGHALPRVRAVHQLVGLFAIATARGAEEQEGYALLLEERAGLLGAHRRRQLAARHLATLAMRDGATFVDVVRTLARDRGVAVKEAVIASERAFRGGDGVRAGLGRERAYLESFARVRDRVAREPADEGVLASGQVSVEAAPVLRPWLRDAIDRH